jgi:plasmid stabilization system protein ParE
MAEKTYSSYLSEEARKEAQKAYQWYEEKQEGLGEQFLIEVIATSQTICINPKGYRKRLKEIRGLMLNRFPYMLLYTIEKDHQVRILSVFHTSRNPESWKSKNR